MLLSHTFFTEHLTEAIETWGANGRFGYSPLLNNKLYWFACVNASQNDSRFKHFTVADLLQQFENYHHPIPEMIVQTKNENLIWNDIIDLPPLSQYAFGNVLLIGDAAHATTPNMGQGACQAIEDAVVLANCISKAASVHEAFKAFEKRRLQRTHFITRNSKRAGDVAQLQNPILIKLRNAFLRAVPDSIKNKQFSKVLAVDF